jgi:hypothetical protein
MPTSIPAELFAFSALCFLGDAVAALTARLATTADTAEIRAMRLDTQ